MPGGAVARARNVVPPDNSGANQYVEVIPTASGGKPSHRITGSSGGSSAQTAIAPSTEQALAQQGTAGVQALALARATAPAGLRHAATTPAIATAPVTTTPAPAAGGSSPASEVVRAVTSTQGGLGPLLPVILVVTLLGAVALTISQRRRRST
jgi:hypothetical protein